MFTAAGGKQIANEGEKDITKVTGANEIVQTNWQTVDIARPLSSVRQICLQGNRVLFGARGGVIYNVESGQETPFGIEDNVYVLDTTEPHAGFWTAGMSHSSADDSLVRNPVSSPISGESEEEEEDGELQTSFEPRENGLYGQEELEEVEETREGNTRTLPKGLQQSKYECTA